MWHKTKPLLINWTEPDKDGNCIVLIRQGYKHENEKRYYNQFEIWKYDWNKEELLEQYFISDKDTYEQYQMAFQVFSAFGGTEND